MYSSKNVFYFNNCKLLFCHEGVCSGWGDPHYITFDGTYYSYQGNCTYTLVEEITKKIDNFGVYIDNYDCAARDRVSCPRDIIVRHESQTIRIGLKTPIPVSIQVGCICIHYVA